MNRSFVRLIFPRRKCNFAPISSRTIATNCISIASSTPNLLLNLNSENDTYAAGVYFKNRTIDELIKSGRFISAINVFDEMTVRDVVTYNLLISGFGKFGSPNQALHLYAEMVLQGIRESSSTFSSVLAICSNNGFHLEGIQIHCRAILLGFSLNLYIGSSLVNFYMSVAFVDVALKLFDEMPERNLATWNLILSGFREKGQSDRLLELFNEMKLNGIEPNGLSFCYLIRGFGNGGFVDEGKKLHCNVIKVGWMESNLFVANALVDFYSSCGHVIDARKSFEGIPANDVISWNSIVSSYANNDLLLDALVAFNRMQFWGKRPSIHSFMGFLNSSREMKNVRLGMQIHCCVLKSGFYYGSVHIQSALIDMYGKCGEIENSISIMESVPYRTLECCNSLMTSLLHCGSIEDVIEMFGLMVDEGIRLDEVSFSTTLKALSGSSFASLASCRLIHCCVVKLGLENNIVVSCSLIDAYSRCGHVEISSEVFDKISSPNVVCFTSVINGYAHNGMGRECLETLKAMIEKGLKPDRVTFLCVLSGCNHSGLVEEGRFVFESMKTIYDIHPDEQHYSCMIDLLGRGGLLQEAEELLHNAPSKGNCTMWSSLLRSCRVYRNEMVGRRAAKFLMDLKPEDPAVLLQASIFYSEIGEFETSMQIREIAMARKVTREIGHSLIELNSHT